MQNIEDVKDVKEDPCDLGEGENTIPTYHWSEIQVPRFSDKSVYILTDEISLTQKVNINSEAPKVHPPKPAVITYDVLFLQSKLLEVIVPIICSWKEEVSQGFIEDDVTGEDISTMSLSDLTHSLTQQLATAIHSSIRHHDEAVTYCEERGIKLPYTSKALLRSFKLAKLKDYRQVRTKPTIK